MRNNSIQQDTHKKEIRDLTYKPKRRRDKERRFKDIDQGLNAVIHDTKSCTTAEKGSERRALTRLRNMRYDFPTVKSSVLCNACVGPDLPPHTERDLELRSRGLRGQRTWDPAPPKHRATQQQLRGSLVKMTQMTTRKSEQRRT